MKLVTAECRFRSHGCKVVLKLNEKSKHEETCKYNIDLPCPFMPNDDSDFEIFQVCQHPVTTKSIISHLKNDHKVESVTSRTTTTLITFEGLEERLYPDYQIIKYDRLVQLQI